MSPSNSSPARRPTIRTVAEAVGVSTATVSYVLGGKPGIPKETAERVFAAVRQLGYRPNRAAQSMRTGRSGLILLSLRMLSDPWALSVSGSVGQQARAAGLMPLILGDGDWADAVLQLDPDVAYLDSPELEPRHEELLAGLVARGQRMVVFSEVLQPNGFDVIRSPALHGAELVLEHLLSLTDNVVCLASRDNLRAGATPISRLRPYRQALAAGRIRDGRIEEFDGTPPDALRVAISILRRDDRPQAIHALTDYVGLAVIQAAQSLGLVVGRDLLVTGLGSSLGAAAAIPSLTTAGPEDFFERQAALLIEASQRPAPGPGEGRVHEFPWSLVPGSSTVPDSN